MHSALTEALATQQPHPENVNLDLLADALFPLIENHAPEPESEYDLVSRIMAGSPGQHTNEMDREPRCPLLRRVKDGLEPDIEPYVRVPSYVVGWTPCLTIIGRYSSLTSVDRRVYAHLLDLCKHRRQPHAHPPSWPQRWWNFMRDRGFSRNQVMYIWSERMEKDYKWT